MGTEISWIERFYSHFLGRDICYLFSGGLFITVVEYAYWGKIRIPEGLSLEVLGYLMLSYFVGISISAIETIIAALCKFYISGDLTVPEGYTNLLSFNQALLNKYDEKILNALERFIFLKNASQNVGLSSFLAGVLMIILALIRLILKIGETTVEYDLLAFSLIFFGIIMIFESNAWNKYINKTWQGLADEIATETTNRE